jgi:Uma2 family endonuclease
VLREAPVQAKRWTRVQYERAIDRGIFHEDERLELLDGVLVVKEPQGDRHAVAVDLVALALRRAFGDGWLVRTQVHFASGRLSRPEPDVYVVRGSPRDYLQAAPDNLALVVEVSDSRLALDRGLKGAIYARAGIQDYWIVNLVASEVQVHRDPGRLPSPGRGPGYRSIETFRAPSVIAPLAVPTARIAVADLLP